MKIFLDSANITEIAEINDLGIIDGITTNPTLIAKEKGDFKFIIKKICDIVKTDVSVEVIATDFDGMLEESNKILSIAPNIVIKLPITWPGIKVCKYLVAREHKVNMTLCFTVNQALLAAKAGATYVSPFIGRLEDIGHDGVKLIHDIKFVYNNYEFSTLVLAASIRNSNHFYQAALNKADIITISGHIIKQLITHPLTDSGLKNFIMDWKNSGRV